MSLNAMTKQAAQHVKPRTQLRAMLKTFEQMPDRTSNQAGFKLLESALKQVRTPGDAVMFSKAARLMPLTGGISERAMVRGLKHTTTPKAALGVVKAAEAMNVSSPRLWSAAQDRAHVLEATGLERTLRRVGTFLDKLGF